MQFLQLYASEDAYEHDNYRLIGTYNSMDYTPNDLIQIQVDQRGRLATGRYAKLRMVHFEVNDNTGQITSISNTSGENPKKKRTIINKDAAAARAMRIGKPIKSFSTATDYNTSDIWTVPAA